MTTINARIKNVRKEAGMNQKEFSESIGVTQSGVSYMEQDGRNVSDITIKSICNYFNVNEDWLRNGSGEMFLDFTEDEFSKAANTLSNDAFVRSLIVEYWKLDEDSKKLFRDFIHRLSDNMRSYESVQNDTQDGGKTSTNPPSLSIEEKVEKYRKELELEEKVEEKSKALRNGA